MRLISMLVWMAPLAMLTIGMMVALRVTRNMIVWMRPVAMLISRDDVDAQGDQGLQKQWMVRAQQPIGGWCRH